MKMFWIVCAACVMTASAQQYPLRSASELEPVSVRVESATYKGRPSVQITGLGAGGPEIAIVKGSEFKNGVIEVELVGRPRQEADESLRGFVGIAFRVGTADSLRYDAFYLRPTNGRAEDQLRRNHSTQYISFPHNPWFKLREEHPGLYESYVDLVSGDWTRLKIVVKDSDARLYVHDAEQPCLIVKDLKSGNADGAVALWIGAGTEAYFRNLKISPMRN